MSIDIHGLGLKRELEQAQEDFDRLPEWYRQLPLENTDRLVEANPQLYRRESFLGQVAREAAERNESAQKGPAEVLNL
jgi:hypothetical protein